MKPKHTEDNIMGFVYMATCKYKKVPSLEKNEGVKEHPSAKKNPSAKGTDLKDKKTLLVKFGISTRDNPTRRIEELTKKFNPMKHKCHACYDSAYHKCIEQYLHAQFKEYRVKNLLSRLRDETKRSYPSQEHYAIREDQIDAVLYDFKKAITQIEGFRVRPVPCPHCDNCRFFTPVKGMENRIIKPLTMEKNG